jgi:hypothetical protein
MKRKIYKNCQKCGESFTGKRNHLGQWKILCGLCFDDLLNESAKDILDLNRPDKEYTTLDAVAENDKCKSTTPQIKPSRHLPYDL